MITKNNVLRVMELFFKNPENKYHLRELERLISLSMPGVRKIVKKLEKEGLLESKKEAVVQNFYAKRDEKFISLKRSYNLYSVYDSGLLQFLKEKYEEPEAIILFGSYSKGEDTSKSDIDIAIITHKQMSLSLAQFEKKLSRKITIYETIIKKTEEEFLNTLANGIILHGYFKVF